MSRQNELSHEQSEDAMRKILCLFDPRREDPYLTGFEDNFRWLDLTEAKYQMKNPIEHMLVWPEGIEMFLKALYTNSINSDWIKEVKVHVSGHNLGIPNEAYYQRWAKIIAGFGQFKNLKKLSVSPKGGEASDFKLMELLLQGLPQIQQLRLSHFRSVEVDVQAFQGFCNSISNHALETFHYHGKYLSRTSMTEASTGMVLTALAASNLENLKWLTIPVFVLNSHIDSALSTVIRQAADMYECKLDSHGKDIDLQFASPDSQKTSMNLLVKAVGQNYTIISFSARLPGDLIGQIDPILELNQAGRKFVNWYPGDKDEALEVLSDSKVRHNIDAIFYHLQETPFLFV